MRVLDKISYLEIDMGLYIFRNQFRDTNKSIYYDETGVLYIYFRASALVRMYGHFISPFLFQIILFAIYLRYQLYSGNLLP